MNSNLERLLNNREEHDASETASSLGAASTINADDAAQAVDMGPKLGADPNELVQDPQGMRSMGAQQRNKDLLKGAPKTQEFINSEPVNAALANEAPEQLTFVEQSWQKVTQGAAQVLQFDRDERFQPWWSKAAENTVSWFRTSELSRRGLDGGGSIGAALEAMQYMQAIDAGLDVDTNGSADMAGLIANITMVDKETGSVVAYKDATPEQRQQMQQTVVDRLLSDRETVQDVALQIMALKASVPELAELDIYDPSTWPEGIRDNLTASLLAYIPVLATRGRVRALGGAGISAGLGFGEVIGEGVADQGAAAFTDGDLRRNAMIAVPLYAATEFLGPIGRQLRKPFIGVPDELVLKALKKRGFLAKVGAGAATGALEEATAELVQAMLVDWSNGKLDWSEEGIIGYLEQAAGGAIIGAPATAVMEGPAHAVDAVRTRTKQTSQQKLSEAQQIQDAAANATLREKSPEKWRQFMQKVTTEGGKFYAEPEALQEMVQAGEIQLDKLGLNETQVQEAIEAGTRLPIDQAIWATDHAGTDLGQKILDASAMTPDGMTSQEVRNFAEMRAEERGHYNVDMALREQVQGMKKDLKSDLRQQLRASGRSPDIAEAGSEAWSSMISTLAQRSGSTDPFANYGVQVRGEPQRLAVETTETRAYDQGPPKIKGQSNAGSGNKHQLMPHLRSTAAYLDPAREKPLFTQKTNNKNAAPQIDAIDEVLSRHPNASSSPEAWNNMMADALADTDVPVPPYGFLRDINGGGAVELLSRLTEGQIKDADHGFENAALFREAYTSGEISIADTGKLFLWSFLSRGVSPYTQESLFIDAFDGIDEFIEAAAAGTLDLKAYAKWAKSAAPKGSGQPGAGAVHNLNAFGTHFLKRMSMDAGLGDGRSRLQVIHDMMSDPEETGRSVRRQFLRMGESVGIDNKVVSFTLLVAGFDDVLVLDRVQMRQMWNDGRFDGINLYDGYKEDGQSVTGSALAKLTFGARGLLVYEALEDALKQRIDGIYEAIGRPEAASIGRYHWETWVASSQQEASHATIDAILANAKGEYQPLGGVTAKEGEYGSYAYGARYGISPLDNTPYFLYEVPGRGLFQFDVPSFQAFLTRIKKKSEGVIPNAKFKVTEAGNAPWFFQEGVNLDRLAEIAGEVGRETSPDQVPGANVADGADQTISPGSATDQSSPAPRTFYQRVARTAADAGFPDSAVQYPVYHRTNQEFDRFKIGDDLSGRAIWFSPDVEHLPNAHNRGGKERVLKAFVNVQNPLYLDEFNLAEMQDRWAGGNREFPFYVSEEVRQTLMDAGFDGVISDDIYGGNDVDELFVFDPDQIKIEHPAVRTFSQSDPRLDPQDMKEGTLVYEDSDSPIIFFHGTDKQFDKLKGDEVFLTTRRGLAMEHALRGRGKPRLIEATLAPEDPLVIGPIDDDPDTYYLSNTVAIKEAKEKGQHDAILIYNKQGEMMAIVQDSSISELPARMYNQVKRITESRPFKTWFGDSTVVNEDGSPKIVYHATRAWTNFSAFRHLSHFGTSKAARQRLSDQELFSEEQRMLTRDTERTIPAYIRIERPLDLGEEGTKGVAWQDTNDMLMDVHDALKRYGKVQEAESLLNAYKRDTAFVDNTPIVYNGDLVKGETRYTAQQLENALNNNFLDDKPEGVKEAAEEAWQKAMSRVSDIIEAAGFDGIIYRNIVEDKGSTSYVPLRPQQIKSPFNKGDFSRQDADILKQEDRGRITMPTEGVGRGDFIIDLFAKADESTFFHEMGHAGIEILRHLSEQEGAPQQIKDDIAKVHAWMEQVTGEKVTGDYSVAQQEAWAEAFENYLMEGKAPSPTLKRVFHKLAQWMTRIYQDLGGSAGTKATPEISAVMDRMMATDAEIATAQIESGDYELFRERPPFMSAEDWDTYKRVAERADAEAHGKLLEKAMQDVRVRRGKEWRKVHREEKKRLVAEMSERKEYRAIDALADKDDPVLGEMRLDKDILVERYGEQSLDALKAKELGVSRNLYGEGGLDPDQAAEMLGFKNGKQLIDTIAAAPNRSAAANDAAKAEADALVPPLSEDEIKDEAKAALKNATHSEKTARQAAALSKAGGAPTSHQQMNAAAKARAQELLGSMNTRDVRNYEQFIVAARKAANEAQAEFAKVVRLAEGEVAPGGKAALRKAAAAKRRQLLNEHMYRMARDHAKKVEKSRVKFKKVVTKKQWAKLDQNVRPMIAQLLDQYSFQQKTRRELIAAQKERMTFEQFEENLNEQAPGKASMLAVAPSVRGRVGTVNYDELTVDQLEAVVDALNNLIFVATAAQKAFTEKQNRTYSENIAAIRASQQINDGRYKPIEQEPGLRSKTGRVLRQIHHHVLQATTILRRWDGNDNGLATRLIKRPLDEAATAKEVRVQAEMKALNDIYYKHYSKEELRTWRSDRHKIDVPELGGSFTKEFLMAMLMNSGNAGNFQRLTDLDNVKTGNVFDGKAISNGLRRVLEDRDYRFAQDMWDFMNKFWPEIRQLELDTTNTEPKQVEAAVQIEAPDFVTGGYYPIKYDPEMNIKNFLWGSDDVVRDAMNGRYGKAQTAHGHTEERLRSTGMALYLGLDTIDMHVAQVIHDLYMRRPGLDAARYINDQGLAAQLNEQGRVDEIPVLNSWLKDTLAGDNIAAEGMWAIARWARKFMTVAYIGFRIKTALLQPLGSIQAGALVGNRVVGRGYKSYIGRVRSWHNFVMEKSPMMQVRQNTMNREVNEFKREAQRGSTSLQGTKKTLEDYMSVAAFAMMTQTQYWSVDLPVWVGVYEDRIRKGMSEEDAIYEADSEVERTLGSGLETNRAALERGSSVDGRVNRHESLKQFTFLASYLHSKYNGLTSLYDLWQSRGGQVMSVASVKFALSAIQVLWLEGLIIAYATGGADEEWDEEWWLRFIVSEGTSSHPLGRIIGGEASKFGASTPPVYDLAEKLMSIGESGLTAAFNAEDMSNEELLDLLVTAPSMVLMLPEGQLREFGRAVLSSEPGTQLGRAAVGLPVARE